MYVGTMADETIPSDLFATGVMTVDVRTGSKVGGGRYTLRHVLGRGGMGVVWLALDERLGTDVALKFLPPQIRFDAAALDDLRRETARSRKLTHSNIIRIHDLFEAKDEEAFISMEYVEGRNLADLRVENANRVLSWNFLAPLVDQLCAALEYAHGEKIIHRDLKPANLMVDISGRMKLADFGIARTVCDTMSRNAPNHTSGTLLYMSPQQMDGESARPADDIYALGATLYELLTGKPPFYTGNIVHQVRNVQPRPMQEQLQQLDHKNDIPAEVERVIIACLAKDPGQRPISATQVSAMFRGQSLKLDESHFDTTRAVRIEAAPPAKSLRYAHGWNRLRRYWRWAAGGGLATAIGVWIAVQREDANVTAGAREVNAVVHETGHVAAITTSATPVPPATEIPIAKPFEAKTPVSPNTVLRPEPPTQTVANLSPAVPLAKATPVTSRSAQPESNLELTEPRPVAPVFKASPPELATVSVTNAAANPVVEAQPAPTPVVSTENSEPKPPAKILSSATALELLRRGNSHVSTRSKDRIIQIVSERTPVEQVPQQWRLIYHDEKATFKTVEVRFASGEMERVFEPNRLFGVFTREASRVLDLSKVHIDSDRAIQAAVAAFQNEPVTVREVELKLERGYGGLPVWNVKLWGEVPGKAVEDAAIGTVIVLAEDAKILKKDFSVRTEKPAVRK